MLPASCSSGLFGVDFLHLCHASPATLDACFAGATFTAKPNCYKAAVRVYTKPLFLWRKALNVSSDGKTLYDFAARGLNGLGTIHEQLRTERFHFRPSVGLKYNFNGKRRTLYIPPWEERIVDLLIYRLLNRRLERWFSACSYAYRDHTYGLDRCQSRIRAVLGSAPSPVYVVKRDISDYFASVDHEILLNQLESHIPVDDYLFELICERISFDYQDESGRHRASIGIPFGCASACVLANFYLTGLDREVEGIADAYYFRYADDLLLLSINREAAMLAPKRLQGALTKLRLTTKASHHADLMISDLPASGDSHFDAVTSFRHLGLRSTRPGRCHCRAISGERFRISSDLRFVAAVGVG